MEIKKPTYEEALAYVNTNSKPSDLKIVDMRVTELAGAPYPCLMLKLYTNQGIVGYGEVRDMASKTYALMLKSRILGENPCNIDRIFRRIKQFGFNGRQGGGVSGIEMACWDIAGKAYGIPVYQMLGGKFRDKMRIYCDTDANITEDRSEGEAMGDALKRRLEKGYTLLKMDLGISLLRDKPGMLNAPLGYFEESAELARKSAELWPSGAHYDPANDVIVKKFEENKDNLDYVIEALHARNRSTERSKLLHPFTGVQITKKGLDYLESYVKDVRNIIGYEVPLALDHFGHIGVEEIIKLAHRLEDYNIAWLEDPIASCHYDQWKRLVNSTTIPICTGEDIYLADSFIPLLDNGLSIVHPDALTTGGLLEVKKLGDLAEKYGARMVLHQAATPIHALAAAHVGIATANCWGCEFHANDVPWWSDLVKNSPLPNPIIQNGFITPPDAPGFGIMELNEELIAEKVSTRHPGVWLPTDEWNLETSLDHVYN